MKRAVRALLAAGGLALALAAGAAGRALEVATYNLRLDTPADGPNAWPHRRDAVKALIRYHGFDLVATQEALPGQIDDLAAMDGFRWVGVGRDDGVRAGEHAAIFYRHARLRLLAHGDFWLSETPERPSKGWDARCCHRLATWARFEDRASGRRFVAMSVHFDHEGEVARRESARLVLRRAQALAAGGPLLVLGDFNAVPGSEPVALMTAVLRDARSASVTPPYGPEGTFNGFRPERPATERIDHVFVSRHARVLRYGVLTDSIDGRAPSDHYPLAVRLAFD